MKRLLLVLTVAVAAGIALVLGLQSRPADAQQVIDEQSAGWETTYPAITGSFVDAQTGEIVLNVSGTQDEVDAVVAGVQKMAADTGLSFRGVKVSTVKASQPGCDCSSAPKAPGA